MSRKRSINELVDLRNRAAERARNTGSQLAENAANLANQYAKNISHTKSYHKSFLKDVSKLSGVEKELPIDPKSGYRDRKYSENTYKGLNQG